MKTAAFLPLWDREKGICRSESLMFDGEGRAKLLFPAAKILKLCNPTLGKVYSEGRDFIHTPGSDELRLSPGSAIPVLTEAMIHPDPATAKLYPHPEADAIADSVNGRPVVFSNKDFFARTQVEADYQTAGTVEFPRTPRLAPGQLPRVTGKLGKKEQVRLLLIGDSISDGYNATGYLKVPPFMPPYIDLFASGLAERFGSPVTAVNRAVNGTGCRHALKEPERWVGEEADVLVIAYGMNDFGGMEPAEYASVIREIMGLRLGRFPDTEFILVGSMPRNLNWGSLPEGRAEAFVEALRGLESPKAAAADVCAFWTRVLAGKDYYSMTGNGVNHPNDYGHRLYAEVLLGLFA